MKNNQDIYIWLDIGINKSFITYNNNEDIYIYIYIYIIIFNILYIIFYFFII